MRTTVLILVTGGLLLSASALHAAERRAFLIEGTPIAESEVLDARALPTLSGKPDIMVTLSDAAVKKISKKRAPNLRSVQVAVVLDGRPLPAIRDPDPAQGNVVQISGDYKSIAEAARLAKRISGKDPLPDSLDEDEL